MSEHRMTRPPKPTGLAGLRLSSWDRDNETWVSVYEAERQGIDVEDGGKWAVICEKHGSTLQVDTRRLAERDACAGSAEFCEECRDDWCQCSDGGHRTESGRCMCGGRIA